MCPFYCLTCDKWQFEKGTRSDQGRIVGKFGNLKKSDWKSRPGGVTMQVLTRSARVSGVTHAGPHALISPTIAWRYGDALAEKGYYPGPPTPDSPYWEKAGRSI